MHIDLDDYLAHIGVARKSGRYPWGSSGWGEGDDSSTRNDDFLGYVSRLRKEGLSETDIAQGLGISVTRLREAKSIAKNERRLADISYVERLATKGMSNSAIARQMGINESSVRNMRKPGEKDKLDILNATSNLLKDRVGDSNYIDIGTGSTLHVGVSQQKFNTAVRKLRDEGYEVHSVQVDQLGTSQKTTIKVLAPPGTTYRDIVMNMDKIQGVQAFTNDGGRTYTSFQTPLSADSKRVAVRYAEQGGGDADGVIYVRPGKPEYSLGGANYAQVRIAVDGTHFLKGMAVYKDNLPPGVDLVFNTNKSNTGNKLDAMKPIKDNPDYPFGSVVRQITKENPDGSRSVSSVMNLVNEEGKWDTWSRNLSSQMLSKQAPALAKQQLDVTYESRKLQLDEIMSLTNATVRKKMLEQYASDVDAAAVHLKAAALPRQTTQVILPINSLSDKEIYAPNFRNGEKVALIRYPHGGTFEIPELTVNNRNREGKATLGNAPDAVGIHSKVAARLSGADFDGDTVIVIPNNRNQVKSTPALEGLKDFDPIRTYKLDDSVPRMKERTKQKEMGVVSNLITDMTIQGASTSEIARAVRHSMVVIDAEKHHLNYKQSAIDNGIKQLQEKYQKAGGASTIVSRAGKKVAVPVTRERRASEGGSIDPRTGKKIYTPTNETYVDKNGKTITRLERKKMLEIVDDAHTIRGNTPIEKIYADHSNRLKSLANQARKAQVSTKESDKNTSAAKVYAREAASLNAKLNIALKNAPRERQAQVLANAAVQRARRANPDMTKEEIKKISFAELDKARLRTGAKKDRIEITKSEWDAIQAGAIAKTNLANILDNADMDHVKKLATPKEQLLMTSTKTAHAQRLLAAGYTQAEIADQLGVSLTTLKEAIK